MKKVNPLVNVAVTVAGVAAGFVGQKIITAGWSRAFGEDAPTAKRVKQSAKETKSAQKQAKKDGASKDEIAEILDPEKQRPVWQMLLWTLLSTVAVQGLRTAAQRGAASSTSRLIARRPRPNRG